MNLDDDELAYEKLRRNIIKYNQYIDKNKDVPFKVFKQLYNDLNKYIDMYNNIKTENSILNDMINDMASGLTSPITDKKWVIRYYREKVLDSKNKE